MKRIFLVLAIVLGAQFSQAQTKVGDVTLNNKETFEGEELMLNGAGMREKLWFDLYVGGLYVKTKTDNADKVINGDEAMAIKLHITDNKVTQAKMVNAVNEGFENASHGKATAAQKAQFIACFKDKIVSGNIFDIVYKDGTTTVYKKGVKKGSVEGLEFKKALFAIWLGKNPADDDLKEGMLGKS